MEIQKQTYVQQCSGCFFEWGIEYFCAECYVFGHSGGGLAAVIAEQQRPGTFKAMYLYEPVVFGPDEVAADE